MSHGKMCSMFFLVLSAFRTQKCKHPRFERYFKEFYTDFPYFSMVLDPPGKVLISNNVETFVCDGSDDGVA